MDIHIRLNVTARFSINIAVDEQDRLEGEELKRVIGQHVKELVNQGALPDAIDSIEIAEVSDDSDYTILRGTNG